MLEDPVVSIVIPFYDHAQFLPEAVKSALEQTYPKCEVIVVDDAGPRPATEILNDCQLLGKVKLVKQERNLGSAAAKNAGIAIANGSLIVPLDSDDLIDKEYVSETLQELQRAPDLGGVYTLTQVFGEHSFVFTPDCTIVNILSGVFSPTTFLYKRELHQKVGGYKEDVYHDDDELWLSLLEQGVRFRRIEKPMYKYRKHARGKSKSNREKSLASFARYHAESYSKNLPVILETMQGKYFQLQDLYQEIYSAYHEIEDRYVQLLADHEELTKVHEEMKAKMNASGKKRAWF